MSSRKALLLYVLALGLTITGFWLDSDEPSPWLWVRIGQVIFTSIIMYAVIIGLNELMGWLYSIATKR
jgi:hypothetical protein